jgi:hypothetical protein
MPRIEWEQLSDKQYEDMVAVLLHHIYPASEHIDGSGGDGGRDVQIDTGQGLVAFELKSFTGRLTQTRRRQVKRSLTRAAQLSPLSWTLVVPINFTVGEIKWFDGLRETVTFPIDRRGLTWLDGEFASRWFIARYFIDHLSDEVVRLAEVLNQEKAVLAGGAPDALERASRLAQQLNELDPYYRFEIGTDGSTSWIRVFPRYKGAERDRPIGGQFRLRFPDDDEGRAAREAFERAIDFGTTAKVTEPYLEVVSLDMPAKLGAAFEKVTSLELRPSAPSSEPRTFLLSCVDPSGSTLAEVPVDLHITSHGRRGSVLEGTDVTGSLRVRLTVDLVDRKLSVTFSVDPTGAYYPHEMRTLARFLAAYVSPNSLTIRDANGDRLGGLTSVMGPAFIVPWMPQVLDDLALVQWASGMTRKVGPGFTLDDLQAIGLGAALLRGGPVEVTWERLEYSLDPGVSADVRRAFLEGDAPLTYRSHEAFQVVVGGNAYPIGKGLLIEYVASLESIPDDWSEAGTIPDAAQLTFVPGSTDRAHATLIQSLEWVHIWGRRGRHRVESDHTVN